MDPINHHVEAHLTVPESFVQAKGRHLGWTRWYNTETIRGRTGVTVLALGLYVALFKYIGYKNKKNNYLAEKKVKDERYDLFMREIEAWEKNGRKFD